MPAQPALPRGGSDVRRIYAAQAVRALAYGFGSVLLGVSLTERGWSSTQAGGLLAALTAGIAVMSVAVGAYGDRIGRRRFYALLFCGLAAAGAVFALSDSFWLLLLVALTGTLSTDVVESGPFSSLEQAMLAAEARGSARVFGRYNAVATLAGSVGALAAGGPALLRHVWHGAPANQRLFLFFVPVGVCGALIALGLSEAVDAPRLSGARRAPLRESRGVVMRLSALFATDAFAGGFIVQSFVAYWFRQRFGVSLEELGLVFFGIGLLQAASFTVATWLSDRIGLLPTMVFTHLPSNLLLACIPLAPNFGAGVALLLGRSALGQMDVPTRQAYVVALVSPEERTAAAAFTNTARYTMRPLGPVLAGVSERLTLGVPFVVAGTVKAAYDVVLWLWFRRVPVPEPRD